MLSDFGVFQAKDPLIIHVGDNPKMGEVRN